MKLEPIRYHIGISTLNKLASSKYLAISSTVPRCTFAIIIIIAIIIPIEACTTILTWKLCLTISVNYVNNDAT